MPSKLQFAIDTVLSAGFCCLERSGRGDGNITHIVAVSKTRVAEYAINTGCIVDFKAGNIAKAKAHPVELVKWLRGGK